MRLHVGIADEIETAPRERKGASLLSRAGGALPAKTSSTTVMEIANPATTAAIAESQCSSDRWPRCDDHRHREAHDVRRVIGQDVDDEPPMTVEREKPALRKGARNDDGSAEPCGGQRLADEELRELSLHASQNPSGGLPAALAIMRQTWPSAAYVAAWSAMATMSHDGAARSTISMKARSSEKWRRQGPPPRPRRRPAPREPERRRRFGTHAERGCHRTDPPDPSGPSTMPTHEASRTRKPADRSRLSAERM